jgi:4-hydroxy-tetrahydrodipicolinate reductase
MNKLGSYRLGVLGLSGRMGEELTKLLIEPRFASRLAKIASPGSRDGLDSMFAADVWLEFSTPAAVLMLVREALRRDSKVPLVVGATGWTTEESEELEAAARKTPILRAANFSLGVQICRMTLQSWREFPELANWRVSIRDLHHTGKKDAPSGTALSLREALGREVEIVSLREGDIFGIHEIRLESDSEKLTLIHEAKSRAVFAEGALETAFRLVSADAALLPKRLLGLEDLYLHRGAPTPYK